MEEFRIHAPSWCWELTNIFCVLYIISYILFPQHDLACKWLYSSYSFSVPKRINITQYINLARAHSCHVTVAGLASHILSTKKQRNGFKKEFMVSMLSSKVYSANDYNRITIFYLIKGNMICLWLNSLICIYIIFLVAAYKYRHRHAYAAFFITSRHFYISWNVCVSVKMGKKEPDIVSKNWMFVCCQHWFGSDWLSSIADYF